MAVSTKEKKLTEITVDAFLAEHGTTERDITSDRWLAQVESNGYDLYCLADSVDRVRDIWDDEFAGERGHLEDNLKIWNIEGVYVAMWSW